MCTPKKHPLAWLTVVILSCYLGNVQAGEPVPGAEVYIELEPGDEAIITNNPTSPAGEVTGIVPRKSLLAAESISTQITFPESFFKKPEAKEKTKVDTAQTDCNLQITFGEGVHKQVLSKAIKVAQGNGAKNVGGPYSQSFSNIEDNMFPPTPQEENPDIPVVVNLSCTPPVAKTTGGSINSYGINDEGIK